MQGNELTVNSQSPPDRDYTVKNVIGVGTFATVYSALENNSMTIVAIKSLSQSKKKKYRELEIHQELKHPNIVQVEHAFYSSKEGESDIYLNIVMEFLPRSLSSELEGLQVKRKSLSLLTVKLYSYQLLRALAYLHARKICHRDIKPANLLLHSKTKTLKLCDFGSAKFLSPSEKNVSYISSRHYRAPELAFGSEDYWFSIDLWSAGCVIGEMLLGTPLFPGDSHVDQLLQIIKTLGTPSRAQIAEMNPHYKDYSFPHVAVTLLKHRLPLRTPASALELVSSLLQYAPSSRPLAMDCLLHPFFADLKECQDSSQSLFEWTPEEKSLFTGQVLAEVSRRS